MPYTEHYAYDLLRGIEDPRPWDILDIVKEYASASDVLLDVGCGPALKLVQLAGSVARFVGMDSNHRVLDRAIKTMYDSGAENGLLVRGSAEQIPLGDGSVDIVTCMVAPHNASEMHRVLKPGGYAIVEKIGDLDKREIKELFGSDSTGPRGRFCDYDLGQLQGEYLSDFMGFSSVHSRSGSWKTTYSLEGLTLLFEQVPAIRDFNRTKDAAVLQQISNLYSSDAIEVTQNRLLFIAQK